MRRLWRTSCRADSPESAEFFYTTLRSGNPELIANLFKGLEGEVNGLLREVVELAYFMRGAITYDQMLERSFIERHAISEFLATRLEAESAKVSPNY